MTIQHSLKGLRNSRSCLGADMIVKGFTSLGVAEYKSLFGTAEILFAALFIPRKTLKLAFILLSRYFAGAVAIELSHGMTPIVPTALLVVIWICAYVPDRSIFLPSLAVDCYSLFVVCRLGLRWMTGFGGMSEVRRQEQNRQSSSVVGRLSNGGIHMYVQWRKSTISLTPGVVSIYHPR